jgi:osmotically-inducible protein OsmY
MWRAVPPSSAGRDDMLAEARLRAALAKDPRTRGAPSLAVRVGGGTAFLDGRLSPDLHDLVASIAQDTKGIHRVECRIGAKGRRRTPMSHGHTFPQPAVPPMPG